MNGKGEQTTAKELWEKINIIMTDSVESKSASDRSNIDVLAKIESGLKFREALESINPGIKSFHPGDKSLV